jgi:hypothetical protein
VRRGRLTHDLIQERAQAGDDSNERTAEERRKAPPATGTSLGNRQASRSAAILV